MRAAFENTRKEIYISSIRSLNTPFPICVKEISNLKPSYIKIGKLYVRIHAILDEWEVSEGWWSNLPLERRYFKVVLENDIELIIFKDLLHHLWYKQRFA